MPRLTRAASQARTREQLIATARELFLRDGYYATSLEKVADAAGYSKGAVYSNFRGKDDLCLAAIDDIRADQTARIAAALQEAGTLQERLTALAEWADRTLGDEAWCTLEVELGSQARRDPALRQAMVERNARVRGAVAAVLAAAVDELDIAPPMPLDELAVALVSLGVGLGLQRAIDHSLPADALVGTIRALAGREA